MEEDGEAMSGKANHYTEIRCEAQNHWGARCPKNEKGHRYRGVQKCWGCGYAFWNGERWSYGPDSRRPRQ